jgi:hypothetical protein
MLIVGTFFLMGECELGLVEYEIISFGGGKTWKICNTIQHTRTMQGEKGHAKKGVR